MMWWFTAITSLNLLICFWWLGDLDVGLLENLGICICGEFQLVDILFTYHCDSKGHILSSQDWWIFEGKKSTGNHVHGVLRCFFFNLKKKTFGWFPPRLALASVGIFPIVSTMTRYPEIPFNPGTGHQAIPKLTALEVRIFQFLTSDPCFGVDDAPKIWRIIYHISSNGSVQLPPRYIYIYIYIYIYCIRLYVYIHIYIYI